MNLCLLSLQSATSLLLIGVLGTVTKWRSNQVGNSLILLLSGLLGLFTIVSTWGSDLRIHTPINIGMTAIDFHIDELACVFLCLLSAITFCIGLYSLGQEKAARSSAQTTTYWSCLFFFVLSMGAVIGAANAITFLLFWEVMSIASGLLVCSDWESKNARKAALIYLGATRIATVFLYAGFLWLYCATKSWEFADWHISAATSAPFLLVMLGLFIKAGAWPFHIWLPYAHPAAPSPVSALMSGVMIKLAIYVFIRLLILDSNIAPPLLFSYITIGIGTISAFWGALFSLVQQDLKRLLAYSSVENIGIILIGLGLCLFCLSHHFALGAYISLTAALLHIFNHGVFKTLLFLSAGTVDSACHTHDMERLGGLGKVMPITTCAFLIGSLSNCALPPMNGFSSKWLIYQSLFQTLLHSRSYIDIVLMLACIMTLAMVGTLAAITFVKAIGTTFLGTPRSRLPQISEYSLPSLLSLGFLASACIFLGVTPFDVFFLALGPIATPVTGAVAVTNVASLPLFPVGSILLLLLFLLAAFFTDRDTRRESTWDCGFGELTARMQINPESFVTPIAHIFRHVLQFNTSIQVEGKDRRHFPERINSETTMTSLLESRVYLPAIKLVKILSRHIASLQAGSIHVYLFYILIAMITLLVAGVRA
ncbi:MAG TPA: proton-conducting transporter membrane subunit [Chroococcales cyanobacterium]